MSNAHINFCFPVKRLENTRLILEPFDVSKHGEIFLRGCKDHPELFDYLPYGPFAALGDFEAFYTQRLLPNPSQTLFAILTNSYLFDDNGTLAGVVGMLNASPQDAVTEIGFITILPPFQRTYVTSNAVGMLLAYALDPPPHGLGLRRCQWQTHASNESSRIVAIRMGFTFEGVQRFQRAIASHKQGNGFDISQLPETTGSKLGQARDTAIFAHYCDEWAEKREDVMRMMEPRK